MAGASEVPALTALAADRSAFVVCATVRADPAQLAKSTKDVSKRLAHRNSPFLFFSMVPRISASNLSAGLLSMSQGAVAKLRGHLTAVGTQESRPWSRARGALTRNTASCLPSLGCARKTHALGPGSRSIDSPAARRLLLPSSAREAFATTRNRSPRRWNVTIGYPEPTLNRPASREVSCLPSWCTEKLVLGVWTVK